MSEVATEAKTDVAPAAQAAPAPQVDIAAITKTVTESVMKEAKAQAASEADAKIQKAFRALAGEKEMPTVDPLLEKIVKDPLGFATNLKEVTKEEIKAENAQIQKNKEIALSVAQPLFDEYPELNTPEHLEYADVQVGKFLKQGNDLKTACEKGLKATVDALKLKSVSDAERDRSVKYAGIPSVGGGGSGKSGTPAFSEEKSSSDFISGMRSKTASFRSKSNAAAK